MGGPLQNLLVRTTVGWPVPCTALLGEALRRLSPLATFGERFPTPRLSAPTLGSECRPFGLARTRPNAKVSGGPRRTGLKSEKLRGRGRPLHPLVRLHLYHVPLRTPTRTYLVGIGLQLCLDVLELCHRCCQHLFGFNKLRFRAVHLIFRAVIVGEMVTR